MTKTPEELFQERHKRVYDTIALRQTDRVPFMTYLHNFPARYSGFTARDLTYDFDKLESAWTRTIVDFEPDMFMNPYGHVPIGPTFDALDYKLLLWPGHGAGDDVSYQYVEGEYMKADEYDEYMFDPSGFMLRKYLPRTCGALKPFEMLLPMPTAYYIRTIPAMAMFGLPQVAGAVQAALRAGEEAMKLLTHSVAYEKKMAAIGFPSQYGTSCNAPYDYIGDYLRGTKGVFLDLLRQPDKLLACCDKVTQIMIDMGVSGARRAGIPVVVINLHKGAEGFMSLDQFKTFYWPSLRKLLVGLIDAGLIPRVFFEGGYTSRLEVIRDIPAGKAVYWFERSDLRKAKEILGDRVCIRGNVPGSLLCTGAPEEVDAYCRDLIRDVGRGGGFILDGAVGVPDEARPENVMAMARSVRKYAA